MDHIVSINDYNLSVIEELMNLDLDILLYPDIGMKPFTHLWVIIESLLFKLIHGDIQ